MSEVKELPKEFQSLIKKHLPLYEDLHCGRREPSTPSQVHFVDVVCGKTTKTLTIHEQAYMAWLT